MCDVDGAWKLRLCNSDRGDCEVYCSLLFMRVYDAETCRSWRGCGRTVWSKANRVGEVRLLIILRSVGEVLVPLVAKCLFTKSSLQNKNNSKDCVVDLRVTKGLDAKQKGKGRE